MTETSYMARLLEEDARQPPFDSGDDRINGTELREASGK